MISMAYPEWIRSFIVLYASDKGYQSILSLGGDGTDTLAAISHETGAKYAAAILGDYKRVTHEGIRIIQGDSATILSRCKRTFDLILLFPPSMPPRESRRKAAEERDTQQVSESGTYHLLILSALHLSENGALISIIPRDLFKKAIKEGFFLESGLSCEAALTMPRDLTSYGTEEEQLFIIIKKGRAGLMMVGELLNDTSRHAILLQNLKQQKNGKKAELGVFIRSSEFRTLDEIHLEERVRQLAEEHGAPRIPFSGITRSIITGACGTLHDAGRRIYLPFSPDAPPVISSEDLSDLSTDAACILLRPGTVEPEYLIGFLQTELGRAIRELVGKRSGTIDHFSDTLARTEIYLPAPQIQAEVIAINTLIESEQGRLKLLQKELWMHPLSSRSTWSQIETLREGERIEEWIETLPYPLASILWAYLAERSPARKVSHLFHFFEAAAEFIAGILLSALEPAIMREGIDLLDEDPEFRDIYKNATFRSWIIICRRAGRHIRKRFSSGSRHDEMKRQFGYPGREFIDNITSKRLFALFDEIADLRNDWKGHGGIAGEREREEQLVVLERLLTRFRERIRDTFNDVMVIQPSAAEYHDGIFFSQVKSITGTRPRFLGLTINSLIPLDTGSLYLYSRDSPEPLKLLPLFLLVFHQATGEPAWYFYNRIDGKKVRWVSYHYEAESGFEDENEDVYKMMNNLGLITGE